MSCHKPDLLQLLGDMGRMLRTEADRRVKAHGMSRAGWVILSFGVLALGLVAFQLMLDRGQDQDWFGSREIIKAVLGGLGIYLFVVHLLAAEQPFIAPRLFRDRNLSASPAVMFAVGMVLLAPWLQTLADYPVAAAGLVMAPRGFGIMRP